VLFTGRKFDPAVPGRTKIEVTRTRSSPFSPSRRLLDEYKAGDMSWETFQARYLAEMRDLYADDPSAFHALIDRAAKEDITLTCWEKGDESTVLCHRRPLKRFLVELARRSGLEIDGAP
jgi:uncharacterized protein YeaO (DUF488 family)